MKHKVFGVSVSLVLRFVGNKLAKVYNKTPRSNNNGQLCRSFREQKKRNSYMLNESKFSRMSDWELIISSSPRTRQRFSIFKSKKRPC